jgi:hypothetical protein
LPGEFRPSLPGERRGGRQKGTPNKADATIKEMVIKALHHAGGVDYLARQAEQNPVAFMGLVGRVLPLQVTGESGGPVHITFEWAPATPVDTSAITPTLEATDLEIAWDKPDEC